MFEQTILSDTGVGEGQILTPDQQQKLVNERFALLMAAAFHDRLESGAMLLETSRSSLSNWIERHHSPPAKKKADCLRKMVLPENSLKLAPEEWEQLLDDVYPLVSKRLAKLPVWVLDGGQLQALESYAEPNQLMILITRYADNDTELADVCDMVEENLKQGVSYLYVVPSTCRNLRDLRDLVKSFESHTAGYPAAGTARIMCVPSDPDEEEWLFIDHVLMVLGRVPGPDESFSDVVPKEITHCFEQIFRPGEVTEGHRVWIETPHRKVRLYLDLLRRWEGSATVS